MIIERWQLKKESEKTPAVNRQKKNSGSTSPFQRSPMDNPSPEERDIICLSYSGLKLFAECLGPLKRG